MSLFKTSSASATLCATLLFSTAALAHPELLSSTPIEGADGPSPASIELHFSENLLKQFSGAKLVMTKMAGMSHPPMPVKATVAGASDEKTMVITPAAPLASGSYQVQWRAVSADTHPITGNLSFSVQ